MSEDMRPELPDDESANYWPGEEALFEHQLGESYSDYPHREADHPIGINANSGKTTASAVTADDTDMTENEDFSIDPDHNIAELEAAKAWDSNSNDTAWAPKSVPAAPKHRYRTRASVRPAVLPVEKKKEKVSQLSLPVRTRAKAKQMNTTNVSSQAQSLGNLVFRPKPVSVQKRKTKSTIDPEKVLENIRRGSSFQKHEPKRSSKEPLQKDLIDDSSQRAKRYTRSTRSGSWLD